MLDVILNQYEKRVFAIPNEYEIHCYVCQILRKKEKKSKEDDKNEEDKLENERNETNASSAQENFFDDKKCVKWAVGFISKDGNSMKTLAVLQDCMVAAFPNKHQSFETNKREVHKKLSQLKQKVKLLAMKSIV